MDFQKTGKRWIAMLLACAMIFTLCPIAAFAEDTRTDIVVSNIKLSADIVALTGIDDERYVTITADVEVPADFDGTKPFYFWFQEQVPEEQHRGYDEVYASQDTATGKWTISGQICVTTWWPQGEYKLSHVTYETHEQKVSFTGDVTLTVDRSQVSDNADPVAADITVTSGGNALASGGEVQWSSGAELKICVAVEDDNHLTTQGHMVLRSDNNARYEGFTEYVSAAITDDSGNITGYTREMVLTVNVADLEPGTWHIEHFTVDDVYGNYVFYNYNGDETDSDGNDNGNDDLLDGVTFTVASDAVRVFFVNEDDRWDAANGFYVELKKENGDILTGKSMMQLEDGINGWVWYAWIDAASWTDKYSVTVYNGNDNTASESITTNEMTGTADMLVRSMDEAGNIIPGLDTFDPDKWMGGGDGGESGHEVCIHIKDDSGNLIHESTFSTPNSGTIDLSDEGITLNFDVPAFVFPGDAGALEGTALEFVGWWVKETGQLIAAGSSDEIATDAYQINLYPQYTAAPFRVQAHYVNENGDQQTDTQWVSVPYGTSVSAASAGFDLNSIVHIPDHQFVDWFIPYAATEPLTPDLEGVVHVAEYDQLYFTFNYEYLIDVEINGQIRQDWMHEAKTFFVSDATYSSKKVEEYFLTNVAPNVRHTGAFESSAISWDHPDWEAHEDEISFGNCYGLKANYGATRLYFLNTDLLWNTDSGLFMQVLDDQGAVVWSGGLDPVVGSIDNYCWYAWVDNTALENKESLNFKVYAGADENAASWTNPIALPGDTDMVVLVVNDAPASGGFEAGNDHFDLGGWYMDNGGNEGGEGEGGGGEVSGHAVNFYVSADGGMEHIFRLETDADDVSFSTEFSKLSAEDQARLTVSQYTFPEWADNGLANTTLAFEGWLVLETGELITAANDLIMNVEEYEINLVAQFTQVPVCMAAGYVDSNGVYQVYSQWYSIAHGTRLGDVLDGFEAELSQLSHSEEYQFLEWNILDDWDRDSDVYAAISSVEYVAVHEKKYVTVNYTYLADIDDGNGGVDTEEINGAETIFVDDNFTDLDVANYFLDVIAPTLTDHAGDKTPVWKYDHWTPGPTVSGNANCYGIYAEYPVEMDANKVTAVTNEIESATEGTTVTVDMNTDSNNDALEETATVVPAAILEAAADKKVDVVFDMGGYHWTVDGSTVNKDSLKDINLKVDLDGQSLHDIDPGKTEDYGYKQQISIGHDGEFGFTASLEIPVVEGLEEQFRYAILLYYVPMLGKLMPIASRPVEEGKVAFEFSHASDYLVVYSESEVYPVVGADLNGDSDFTEEEVFSTLAEAVTAANSVEDQTEPVWVLLARDTVETETITVTGNIRLELGSCDIAALPGSDADTILFHVTTGQLTVDALTDVPYSGEWDGQEGTKVTANGELFRVGEKDGSSNEAVALTVNGGSYVSQNDCCIVIYDGVTTLNADNEGMYSDFYSYSESYAAIQGSGKQYGDLTVNGANICSEYEVAIYWPQNGTLTITDGSITGGTSAIYAKQGAVNISGGNFYGYGEKTDYTPDGNGCNGTGDTIVLDNCGYGELSVSINGGYFYSAAGDPVGSYAAEGYTALEKASYMAPGCDFDNEGNVVFVADSETALVNGIQQAGENGMTVMLTGDIALTAPLTVEGTVEIDLNGHTLSATSSEAASYSMITNYGELTISDSSEDQSGLLSNQYTGETGSIGYYVNTITNLGTLTVTGGTVRNASTASGQVGYAVDNNSTSGDVRLFVEGGTVMSTNGGYYDAIRQFANSETWSNEVYISGGTVGSIWQQNPSDGTDRNTKDPLASLYIWDGTVGAVYIEPNGNATVEIYGGTISSITTYEADTETNAQRIPSHFISGGTFGAAPAGSFIHKDYALEKNEDGSYGIVETPAQICMYSISLGEDIGLNLYLHISEEVLNDESAYMQFTTAGETIEIPVEDVEQRTYMGEEYESFTYHVVAKDMDMDVKAQLFYGGGYTAEITCSVQGYLNYQKEIMQDSGAQDEKLMETVYATESYGRHADLYFNGNGSDQEIQEDPELAEITADVLRQYAKEAQGDAQVKLSAVSLLLRTKTVLRLFFELDGVDSGNVTFTYEGNALEVKERDGLYYVDIEGIAAKDLGTDVTVTVTYETGDGQETFDVVYCPLTYCYNVLSAEQDTYSVALINVVRALYRYQQSAADYLGQIGEE